MENTMGTVEITADNFKKTIEGNDIVLLDYWAEWCAPCKMFGPIFEKVAEDNPDITFGKVNTEQQQELASAFQIRSIPTLMVFKEGVLIFSQPGLLPEPALKELVAKTRELDMEEVRRAIEEDEKKKQDQKEEQPN
jgi:thioredoxin 1